MSEQTTEQKSNNAIFDISLHGKQELKSILGVIKGIVQEATLEIDEEGITFRGMDPSHVCLLDVALPNSVFEKYQVSIPGKFAIMPEELYKIIKDFDKKDTIRLNTDQEGNLSISTRYNSTKIRLIESSSFDTPLPKISYNAKIGIMFNDFKRTLKQIETISEYVNFEAIGQLFKVSGKSEKGERMITFEKGMPEMPEFEVRENTKSMYSLEYLTLFTKAMDLGSIILEYSEKMPLRLEAKMFNVGRVHYYLAPRVEN